MENRFYVSRAEVRRLLETLAVIEVRVDVLNQGGSYGDVEK